MVFTIVGGNTRQFKLQSDNGEVIFSTARKSFLKQAKKLYVGDKVCLDEDGCIYQVMPRENLLYRPKIANVDYMCVVTSLKRPDFSSYLLDKFLTYLNFQNIKPYIVFTKSDLLSDEELEKITKYKDYYESIGIKAIIVSAKKPDSVKPLKEIIKGNTIAFMGQTGAGKSSIINCIDPSIERMVGEFSEALGRGKHMTKEVVLIPSNEGIVGDTPGFSSLELNLTKRDASIFFPGFKQYLGKCFYNNCLHLKEKECKIKEAVEKNIILKESYDNYVRLLEELQEGERIWKEKSI
ncbi:putative ribosome biogenesis GTPase RsgA [Clostridium sp. CAG:288]|nr:putative ribosome biogenesis GTPase RsgA [Clostridium sp. CAG:288]